MSLISRNPLVYPGGSPGVNLTHPAALQTRMFMVCAGGVLQPFVPYAGSIVQLGTLSSATIKSVVGPVITPTGSQGVGFTGLRPSTTNQTFGTIFQTNNLSQYQQIAGSISNPNCSFYSAITTGNLYIFNQSGSVTSTINLLANTPYFAAVSIGGPTINFVARNLITGQTFSSAPSSGGTGYLSGNTSLDFANLVSETYPCSGGMAAVMASNIYLPMPVMLAWAEAPWDFWYPTTVRQTIFSSLRPSSTLFRRTLSPLGTRVGSRGMVG